MNGAVRASERNTWAHLSARPHPEGKVTNLRPENAESLWATATLMERTGQRSTGRHGNQLKLWSYITNEVIWHKDVTVIVNKVFLLQVTVTGVSRAGLTWWGDLELLDPPETSQVWFWFWFWCSRLSTGLFSYILKKSLTDSSLSQITLTYYHI